MGKFGWGVALVLALCAAALVLAVWQSAKMGTQMCPLGCGSPPR